MTEVPLVPFVEERPSNNGTTGNATSVANVLPKCDKIPKALVGRLKVLQKEESWSVIEKKTKVRNE